MNKTITHCFSLVSLFIFPINVLMGFASPLMPLNTVGGCFLEGIEEAEALFSLYEICEEEEAFFLSAPANDIASIPSL